jgi:hypothetical protein
MQSDFWTCWVRAISPIVLPLIYVTPQNVPGRTLVGLRFRNQVDEDGESYRVFESRDVCDFSASSITNLNGNTTS